MTNKLSDRNFEKKILLGLFVIAFLIRFLFIFLHSAIGFDEPHYLQLAATFLHGNYTEIFHPYWPPLYPLVIAFFSVIFGNIEFSARLISALGGSLIVFPIYHFAKSIYGKRLAVLAIFLVAIFPTFLFVDSGALSDSLYKFFSIYSMYFIWKSLTKKSFLLSVLAGAIIGCSYLTKPEGFGYLIIFVAIVASIFIYSTIKHESDPNWSKLIIGGLIGFLIISSPYFIYLRHATGQWTLSAKWNVNQQNLAIGNTSKDSQEKGIILLKLDKSCSMLPVDMAWHSGDFYRLTNAKKEELKNRHRLTEDIKYVIHKMVKNLYKLVNVMLPSVLTTVFLILMALGLFAEKWRKEELGRQFFLIFIIGFYWFLVIPFFHLNPRYFLPLVPLTFIWSAKGIEKMVACFSDMIEILMNRTRQKLARNLGIFLTVGLIGCFSIFPHLAKVVAKVRKSTKFWGEAFELKKAGEWLKENSQEPPIIMSYNKAVDYYAGQYDIRKGVSIPDDNFENILKYARYRNAGFVVLSSRYRGRVIEKFKTDSLDFLLINNDFPLEIEKVYDDTIRVNQSENLITRIFKILPASGEIE